MKRLLLFVFFIFPFSFLFSFDFGIVLDQSIGVGGTGNDSDFDYDAATPNGGAYNKFPIGKRPKGTYSGLIVPRFSGLIGNNGDFYISAGGTGWGIEDTEGRDGSGGGVFEGLL